jgi:uncharacterized membrane protein YkvA (DUF1232 family)
MNSRYARFFRIAESRARHYVSHPGEAARLVNRATQKAHGERFTFGKHWHRMKALIRMLRAWSKGSYRLPARTLIFGLAGLIYFVSPIDAISDFIPVLGLVDDVTVIAFVLNAIGRDLDDFRTWEESARRTIEADNPENAVL